jgi:hypothetical protein
MKRREFLKGAILGTALVASGEALATKGYFGTGKKGLLRLENRENPTVLEKKHVPTIEVPVRLIKNEWFEVKVRVGYMTVHPSTPRDCRNGFQSWRCICSGGIIQDQVKQGLYY